MFAMARCRVRVVGVNRPEFRAASFLTRNDAAQKSGRFRLQNPRYRPGSSNRPASPTGPSCPPASRAVTGWSGPSPDAPDVPRSDPTASIITAHLHRSVYTDHVTPPLGRGEGLSGAQLHQIIFEHAFNIWLRSDTFLRFSAPPHTDNTQLIWTTPAFCPRERRCLRMPASVMQA